MTSSTNVLHTVRMVGLPFHHFETRSYLFITLRTLETLGVPILFHCLELLPHYFLITASTSELTGLFSTGQTHRIVVLHRVFAIREAFATWHTHKASGMIIAAPHIYHSILDELITFATLLQVGSWITLFTQKLTFVFNVTPHQLVLAAIAFEAVLVEVLFTNRSVSSLFYFHFAAITNYRHFYIYLL